MITFLNTLNNKIIYDFYETNLHLFLCLLFFIPVALSTVLVCTINKSKTALSSDDIISDKSNKNSCIHFNH